MHITRYCPITNKENTLDLDVTFEQLHQWEIEGKLIQEVMPNLSDDEREFLISGLMPETFDEVTYVEDEDIPPYEWDKDDLNEW